MKGLILSMAAAGLLLLACAPVSDLDGAEFCAPAQVVADLSGANALCLATAPDDLMGHSTDPALCPVDDDYSGYDVQEMVCSLEPLLEEGRCEA